MSDPLNADLSGPVDLPNTPTLVDEFSTSRYYMRPRRLKRGAYMEIDEEGEGEGEGGRRSWFKKRGK